MLEGSGCRPGALTRYRRQPRPWWSAGAPEGASMLVSRSTEESHLYMYLHPCECGEDDFEWRDHEIVSGNGWLVSIYSGECGRCGKPRSFEFALAPEPSPPPPSLGG